MKNFIKSAINHIRRKPLLVKPVVSHRFSLSEWLISIEGTQKAKLFIISWIFAPMCLCMLASIGWIFSDFIGLFFLGAAMFTFMILTGILLYWIIISN